MSDIDDDISAAGSDDAFVDFDPLQAAVSGDDVSSEDEELPAEIDPDSAAPADHPARGIKPSAAIGSNGKKKQQRPPKRADPDDDPDDYFSDDDDADDADADIDDTDDLVAADDSNDSAAQNLRRRHNNSRPSAADGRTRKIFVVPADERITSNRMTLAEVTRAIAIRAKQISTHPYVYTDVGPLSDVIAIARKELLDRRSPLKLERRMGRTPAGESIIEIWHVREMSYPILA